MTRLCLVLTTSQNIAKFLIAMGKEALVRIGTLPNGAPVNAELRLWCPRRINQELLCLLIPSSRDVELMNWQVLVVLVPIHHLINAAEFKRMLGRQETI